MPDGQISLTLSSDVPAGVESIQLHGTLYWLEGDAPTLYAAFDDANTHVLAPCYSGPKGTAQSLLRLEATVRFIDDPTPHTAQGQALFTCRTGSDTPVSISLDLIHLASVGGVDVSITIGAGTFTYDSKRRGLDCSDALGAGLNFLSFASASGLVPIATVRGSKRTGASTAPLDLAGLGESLSLQIDLVPFGVAQESSFASFQASLRPGKLTGDGDVKLTSGFFGLVPALSRTSSSGGATNRWGKALQLTSPEVTFADGLASCRRDPAAVAQVGFAVLSVDTVSTGTALLVEQASATDAAVSIVRWKGDLGPKGGVVGLDREAQSLDLGVLGVGAAFDLWCTALPRAFTAYLPGSAARPGQLALARYAWSASAGQYQLQSGAALGGVTLADCGGR